MTSASPTTPVADPQRRPFWRWLLGRPAAGVVVDHRIPIVGRPAHTDSRNARPVEIVAGLLLVGATALLGLVVASHSGSTAFDRWARSVVGGHRLGSLRNVTELGSRGVLAAGTVVVAVLGARRGLRAAVACAVGPPVAAVLAETVVKPVVGRHLAGVLTFPSGTVVVIAALTVAAALATDGVARSVVLAAGLVATALAMVAVVTMNWHFPSDAVGGAAWGSGVVLLLHGLVSAPARPRPPEVLG